MGYYPNDPLRTALATIARNKRKTRKAINKEQGAAWASRAGGRYLPKPKRDPLAPPSQFEPVVPGGAIETNRRRH